MLATLGAPRVLDQDGSLPQPAKKLSPAPPVADHEIEVDVDALYLDSTSFRQLREEAEGRPSRIAKRIAEITEGAGKMHNPVTGSGGVLVGRVSAIGTRYPSPPQIGTRICSLASLTQIPLRLSHIDLPDTDSARISVRGVAYLAACAPWATMPTDMAEELAIAVLDVCGSATHTRNLARPGDRVLILGAGHAGLFAAAAAREVIGASGLVIAADHNPAACSRAQQSGLFDRVVAVDLCDALSAVKTLISTCGGPADLTIVVVNSSNCELSAILSTRNGGTVLFFSMATSFTAAALGAEGVSRDVSMIIGSGFAGDRGSYALGLVRKHSGLLRSLLAQ